MNEEPDEDSHDDPRLQKQDHQPMAREVIDTEHNMPGQQGPPPGVDDDGDEQET